MDLKLAIIGPGTVGTAIGIVARRNGVDVAMIGGRNAARTRQAAARIGAGVASGSIAEAAAAAPLVLLTVADDAIAAVVRQLLAAGKPGPDSVLAHCSGALSSEVLQEAAATCGCAVGSAHPLQTFPGVDAAVARLPGTYWFYEGEPRALPALRELGTALGVRPVRLQGRCKSSYHAMAVMACNYLTALMDAALALGERAGIPREEAWRALAPLIDATLSNIGESGPAGALTGPIQRGDVGTVQRHLRALAGQGELQQLYRALGSWTAALAQRGGHLDPAALARLREVLTANPPHEQP